MLTKGDLEDLIGHYPVLCRGRPGQVKVLQRGGSHSTREGQGNGEKGRAKQRLGMVWAKQGRVKSIRETQVVNIR